MDEDIYNLGLLRVWWIQITNIPVIVGVLVMLILASGESYEGEGYWTNYPDWWWMSWALKRVCCGVFSEEWGSGRSQFFGILGEFPLLSWRREWTLAELVILQFGHWSSNIVQSSPCFWKSLFFFFAPGSIVIGPLNFNVIYKIVIDFKFNQFSS